MSMERRSIRFESVEYPFFHGVHCTDEIASRILELDADRYVLVVDAAVEAIHAAPLVALLERRAPVIVVPLPASERTKSLDLVQTTLETAFRLGMTRRSCVLGMGGGVVGNMAGLCAALAFRGVRLVHLPTTVIAAMDSVLSLKQAVNARVGKNLVGTFHAPTAVLLDHAWLTTLPVREVRSGLCELVKNALAIAPASADRLLSVARPDCRLAAEDFRGLVDLAIDPKLSVMEADPREKGRGLALEYGHTIGHAIELAAPGSLSHGEAVAIGMLCAADVAASVCGLGPTDHERHAAWLGRIGVTIGRAPPLDRARMLALLRHDNKRGYVRAADDEIPMILLEALGRVSTRTGSMLTPVPVREVERALARLPSSTARAA